MQLTITGKNLLLLLLILIILILISGGGYFWWAQNHPNDSSAYLNTSDYKAVFLTNGQVYFGKITGQDKTNLTLSAVYYLQNKNATDSNAVDNKNDWTLVKLGTEFHGPTSQMIINRTNILMIETLRSDSKVVQAILQNLNQVN